MPPRPDPTRLTHELEALAAIFPTTFIVHPPTKNAWGVTNTYTECSITLTPSLNNQNKKQQQQQQSNKEYKVTFRLPKGYPDVLPTVTVNPEIDMSEIQQGLQTMLGQEQIYEVITRIQDHLDDSTPSAYQQMIEASQLAELRKEQERKEQLRVAQEVKQMEIATLELKIQQDLNRKHALLVTPRKVSEKTASTPPRSPSPMEMEQEVMIPPAPPHATSRYTIDFKEESWLGKGAFGSVVQARNRLDNRTYAIKKISLNPKSPEHNRKITREVMTLARLYHVNIVRYYQAWVEIAGEEQSDAMQDGSEAWLDDSGRSSPFMSEYDSDLDLTSSEFNRSDDDIDSVDGTVPRQILYIQMEFCQNKTLSSVIMATCSIQESWVYFTQILEGLAHMHSKGVIHRDLKPSNIFLSAEGAVKIGDFGLAVSSVVRIDNQQTPDAQETLSDENAASGPIGTALYVAPEIDNKPSGGYNAKVDMYSLGVIFFELIYPLSTGMERILVLQSLRQNKQFPRDFDRVLLQKQFTIISQLLSEDSAQRPSSHTLLESDLLPPRTEDRYITEAIRTLADTSTPYYTRLMNALFSQYQDKYNDYTYDFNTTPAQFDPYNALLEDRVIEQIRYVFTCHAAIKVESPLFIPKVNINSKKDVVVMMDSTGSLVELPYDATVSFARCISRYDIRDLKRYSFMYVYRQNAVGGQPRQINEADFDIVHKKLEPMIAEAEVLCTITSALLTFKPLRQRGIVIKVNSERLNHSILLACDISAEKYLQIRLTLSQLSKAGWKQISRELSAHLSPCQISSLSKFHGLSVDLSGDPANIDMLKQLNSDARTSIDELLVLKEYMLLDAGTSLCIDPLLICNPSIYHGVCFHISVKQLVHSNHSGQLELLSLGGRYDNLIERFSNPRATKKHAFGGKIALSRITSHLSEHSSHQVNKIAPRKVTDDDSPHLKHVGADVYVVSTSLALMSLKMRLCQVLWDAGISTDYSMTGSDTMENHITHCRIEGIRWLVMLREARDSKSAIVIKAKEVFGKGEYDVTIETIVEVLATFGSLPIANERMRAKQSKNSGHRPTSITESVVIIHSATPKGNKPKAASKKHIMDKCHIAVQNMAERLSSGSHTIIIAVDLKLNIIRRITDVVELRPIDSSGGHNSSSNNQNWIRSHLDDHLKKIVEAHHLNKNYTMEIGNSIKEASDTKKVIILYSYIDDEFDIIRV